MSKRSKPRRHVPQRICVACRTSQPKRTLVRLVRTSESGVMIDETGKHKGRGAYLCRQRPCWEIALNRGQLEKALKVTITAETKAELRDYAATLPQSVATESEDNAGAVEGAST